MINKLKKIIKNLNLRFYEQTDSATVRYYIQISGRYGAKFFTSRLKCEGCYFRQEAAYKMGFGPKPLFMGIKGRYFYYVTEHAIKGGLNQEEISPVMELSDGRYAVIRIDTVQEQSYLPFENVRDALIKSWTDDQREADNRREAEKLVESLKVNEKTLSSVGKDLGLEVMTMKIGRTDTPVAPMNINAHGAFFNAAKGDFILTETDDGYILGSVTSISWPDTQNLSEKDLEESEKITKAAYKNEIMQVFISSLQKKEEIQINSDLLGRMYGPGNEDTR
jgi:hypothetical protein